MENKINIAELLKDCPKGMELDCILFDDVYFDCIDDVSGIIKCYVQDLKHSISISFNKYGGYSNISKSKCAIFPKGKTTWEGFVPPCKFKVGDIISDSLGTCIFKGEGEFEGTVNYYCGISNDYFRVKDDKRNPSGHYGCIVGYRLSTEEEKQKLFDAIKANGYKWNPETKTLEKLIEPKFKVGDRIKYIYFDRKVAKVVKIHDKRYELDNGKFLEFQDENAYEISYDKFDISTLIPFESKVLVRDNDYEEWRGAFWGHLRQGADIKYDTIRGVYIQCIPYEGNEHLLGKTNDCDEFYKTWK